MAATLALVICTIISLVITYALEKRIAMLPLVSGVMVAVLGGMTLWLNNDYFIKIKPTMVNLLFASVLLGGLLFKKPMLKYVLASAMSLREEGWRKLSLRWGLFFVFLAALNEYIWRNYSVDFWVNFKVFGMFSCTMLFTLSQIPLIKHYWIEENNKE